MQTEFVKRLNAGLRALNKKERDSHIFEYQEMIKEYEEEGRTKKEIEKQFGDVKMAAANILDCYEELEKGKWEQFLKFYNKVYVLGDILISIVIYGIVYFAILQWGKINSEAFVIMQSAYLWMLPVIILCMLGSNYLFQVYSIKKTRNMIQQVFSMIAANFVCICIIHLILFLPRQFHFSRLFLFVFFITNLILEIFFRIVLLIKK